VTDVLINEAVKDKVLIAHIKPGYSNISASTLVNLIAFEFLNKWYNQKHDTNERH
jgi:hypothetical protein